MNEINQSSINKPDAPITRFFILPVKPFVAKFLFTDPKNLFKILSSKEKEVIQRQFEKMNEKNHKHFKGRFWFFLDWKFLFAETIQNTFKFHSWLFIDNKYLKKTDEPCTFEYYHLKKKLPDFYKEYLNSGYQLIKVTCKVRRQDFNEKPNVHIFPTIQSKIDFFNQAMNDTVLEFISLLIYTRGNNTIKNAINDIYTIYDLTSDDIKKTTIEKYYQRNKNKFKRQHTFFGKLHGLLQPEKFHSKINNSTIIHNYQLFLENKLSLNQIAEKLNISESTIKRIFSNPDIQKSLK
jgi:AraC-like DNA-binding protein